jgi:hypothetical protein
MSMKTFYDTIGNRNRDLPTCNAVPQPTVPPRAPNCFNYPIQIKVARFKVSTVLMQGIIVFWDVALCDGVTVS